MKKFWILLLPLTLLFACSGDKGLEAIREGASAQVAIERLRKESPPSWAVIQAEYEKTLPMVLAADQKWGTNYEKEIPLALALCQEGTDVEVNQQVLAKGLQHAAVLGIRDNLAMVREDKHAAARATAYFEGIRPTFVRRDKDYFAPDKPLEQTADRALTALAEDGEGIGTWTAARELLDVMDRTYALCVLYELQSVEKLRDDDRAECAVKMKEAEVFWRIIAPRVKKTSSKAYETIAAMLGADYGAVDAKAAKEALSQGLSGIQLL